MKMTCRISLNELCLTYQWRILVPQKKAISTIYCQASEIKWERVDGGLPAGITRSRYAHISLGQPQIQGILAHHTHRVGITAFSPSG